MARPSRCRKICFEPTYDSFIPEGISNGEKIILTLDEYEVIRLIEAEVDQHREAQQGIGQQRQRKKASWANRAGAVVQPSHCQHKG